MNHGLLELAMSLIKGNAKDYLIVLRTDENEFELVASSRTWGIGAALRTEGVLAEMDREEEPDA